jgi:haloalkane dehalogenase
VYDYFQCHAGEGDPIVAVHGEPTWGYLYRNFIRRLARLGRVIVPDHMGFGKSETPQDRTYSTREHVDNLERLLIEHLDLTNITFVGQDWGGPLANGVALRHPDRVKRLCYMNTVPAGTMPSGVPMVTDYPWFKWVNTREAQAVLSNLGGAVLSVMKRIGFERTGFIDETWIRAYASPFPSPAECKGAVQFPANIAAPETAQVLLEHVANLSKIAAKPAMYVHGESDRAIPMEMAVAMFRSTWPEGPIVTLPGVGHFIQEDAPVSACALIEQFIQMT